VSRSPASPLAPLSPQPEGVPWPTREWAVAPPPSRVDAARLDRLLDEAFADPPPADLGVTHATVVVHRGAIVAERYASDVEPDETLPSWSMAKSALHAVVGILVGDGRLDPARRAEVPEWSDPADPRHAITLEHLLRMVSGLEFLEDYVDAGTSHAIEMLFGDSRADTAAYAAAKPLAYPPGTFFSYSSGSSNIVSRIVADAIGGGEAGYAAFLRDRLLHPIGMTSSAPLFDGRGTWIASSFLFSTARDFARFGYLYLRDGTWDGARLLPAGWVDHARTPTPQALEDPYGAHWWLVDDGLGTFSARGYEGQYTVVVPALDLVVVRLGKSPAELKPNVLAWLGAVVGCFRAAA
jgi:CubicO group peptidase (beta-lactamase class C family)